MNPIKIDLDALEAIMAVQENNDAMILFDPKGDHPKCKPMTCGNRCRMCGELIDRKRNYACPAIAPENRWIIQWDKNRNQTNANETVRPNPEGAPVRRGGTSGAL